MREPILLILLSSISTLISIPRRRWSQPVAILVVWDTQTGIVIKKANIQLPGEIMFHGDQRTITLVPGNRQYYMYDALEATQIHEGKILSSLCSGLGAHWIHGGALRFSTSFKTDGKFMINIYELQPTSTPPLHVLFSFPVPPHSGEFSFSPVSFHASFVTNAEVIILDVRDSKLLLQTKVARVDHSPPGQFSADGQLFACGVSEHKIYVWQKTPIGYVAWSCLRPRLPFNRFSWSPTSTSISCWGLGGIQLLHPDKSHSPMSDIKAKPHHVHGNHLVAYSEDGAYIVTARQNSGVVTILAIDDPHTPLHQFTDMDIKIQDLGIFNTTALVVDTHQLVYWNFGTDGTFYEAHCGGRVLDEDISAADEALIEDLMIDVDAEHLTLSDDCSRIAFTRGATVFLNKIDGCGLPKSVEWEMVPTAIRFSPNGRELWFTNDGGMFNDGHYLARLEIKGEWAVVKVASNNLEDQWSWPNLFSHGIHVRMGSGWVVSPRGKILWLPPAWRTLYREEMKWNGNFLALLSSHHQDPIIIEFQPQSFLPLHT